MQMLTEIISQWERAHNKGRFQKLFEMVKGCIFLLAPAILLSCIIAIRAAKNDDIISFPYEKKPCTGKLLGAVCCQGVQVNPIDFNKTACVDFKLKLLPPKVDVKITLDNGTIAEFEIDPKKPPTYCVPVVLPVPVAMCIRLHDIKVVGLGIQVCSTIYVNYETNEVYTKKMPCLMLTSTGIDVADG